MEVLVLIIIYMKEKTLQNIIQYCIQNILIQKTHFP